ncbi:MAG TPA: hypothetical protein VFD35_03935 [Pricia sp.]|nr:hypothetical protein [Pricia sp.]
MKKTLLLLLFVAAFGFVSCDKDQDDSLYADYQVARPLKMTTAEFRSGVDVIAPVPILESGKIYAYKNFIFINDKNKGIHVVDNTDPSNPKKISFIEIPGNVDISIKDDFLFADSLSDLVVLDISDMKDIKQVNRLQDVLQSNVFWPVDADIFENDAIDYGNEILVGWEVVTERRLKSEVENGNGVFWEGNFNALADAAAPTNSTTGQGGSLARFKIVDDYLYAVDFHDINIFNISDLGSPKTLGPVSAGFDIETIFNQGQYLFLGSMSGMFIYDISSPAVPTYVSEFQHGTACDPVVVDDDYAYVTLRGGSACGATESGLLIIDISNIANPVLQKEYPMDGPYGLGIKDEKLFICDGDSGLKVYDKTDVDNLVQLSHFKDINTFDVIPLENNLLMTGKDVIYQYKYLDDNIRLLSTLRLN